MAKSALRITARKMRQRGESIKVIAKKIGVSSGSVSLWCRDVILTDTQLKELERRARDPNYGRRLQNSLRQRKAKEEKIERLLKEGIKETGKISKRELFIAGAALYWAEGFKKDKQVGLASLDASMVNFYVKWLKVCFGYSFEDLIVRVTINISHKKRTKEIEKHWSDTTGIPLSCFRRPFYQNFIWKKIYEKPDEYFGVLRVKVRKSTDFLRKIAGYIEGLRMQA